MLNDSQRTVDLLQWSRRVGQAALLTLELGGSAFQGLSPLRGMHGARITLYKYPNQPIPPALEPRLHQVTVSPIYKRYGE